MRVGRPGPSGGSCLAVAGAVLVVTACSAAPAGEDTAPAVGVPEPVASAAVLVHDADDRGVAPGVELRSRVTRIAGHLTDVRRERVAREARATVLTYLDAASGHGERPFRRFVGGLRRPAAHDEDVLVATGEVEVARAAAWFAVAAPEGRPVGITARLRVDLTLDDGAASALTGRLLLTRSDGQWQVFGYDLARGER